MNRWFLNGWFKASCRMSNSGTFSTYHNMENGHCAWCGRTEKSLVKAGALWVDVLGNIRPEPAAVGQQEAK